MSTGVHVVTCSASSIVGIKNFGDELLTEIYRRWIVACDGPITASHLSVRQPDVMLAGVEMRMRPAPHELVPHRRLRPLDRIVVAVRTLPPAIEDAQHNRTRTGGHRAGPVTMGRPEHIGERAPCR